MKGRVIYRGRGSEAAKIYKINGQFYVFLVDNDARDDDRKQVVLRGPRLDGPLERRVILERGNQVTRSCSQGALVRVPDGSWWLTHQLRQAPWQRNDGILWNESFEGRPQYLVPVTWQDGWPVVGEDVDGNGIGNTVHRARKPVPGFPITAPQTDDDFNSTKLGLQWQWNHNPRDTHWSLAERPGWLRLKAGKPVQGGQRQGAFWNAANTLSQRHMGTGQGRATAVADLSGMKPGQRAGLCHFGGQYVLLGVKVDNAGSRRLFFNHDGQELSGPEYDGDRIHFRTDLHGNRATFSFSRNGKQWEQLGPEFELRMGHWRGNRIGFFCWNDQTEDLHRAGQFDVDWFQYTYDGAKGYEPR
jgi:beta-xylosidase